MQESQHEVVRREFGQQATRFGEPRLTLSNQAYLQWMVEQLNLQPHFEVLDVAAGTGHLSRAIAPHVRCVVALDLTPEMLAQGQREAEQQGLTNVVFEPGEAEHLPYANEAFDLVVTRFSLHHFTDARGPVREMVRVCRTALNQDLQGLATTGMRPYLRDQQLEFRHAWFIAVGVK